MVSNNLVLLRFHFDVTLDFKNKYPFQKAGKEKPTMPEMKLNMFSKRVSSFFSGIMVDLTVADRQ